MQLNHYILQLLNRQIKEWPLATANYAALYNVKTKKVAVNGFEFAVQFNPARIASSTANIDPVAIQERPCLLCPSHLPPEQEGLPYTAQSGNEYLLLCNPFPIFPCHLTLPDVHHTDQLIVGRIVDMLELSGQLTDFVLLYNGPKSGASVPDHFHFQAGSKGFLPIQALVERGASIERYPASAFVIESKEPASVAATFHLFYEALHSCSPQEPEPMLNLLCWKTDHTFYLVIFPRTLHRPSQFFAEGDAHLLLSPGTVDLSGVVITPLEKDFLKITSSDVRDILSQVSISRDLFNQIVNTLNE
jgi:hypothetical protein